MNDLALYGFSVMIIEKFVSFQSVCPSHNNTFEILSGMLDEVIALHADIRYIHIGCDEVYQLGVCSRCTSRRVENRWSMKDLFLDHVTRIARQVLK